MIELLAAHSAFVHGGTLPDGNAPTYSDDLPGNAATGMDRLVVPPTGDLGFGADLSCFDDFTPDFQMIDPASTLAVMQSNFRRLNTPLGFLDLINEPSDYGKDVRDMLQKGMKPGDAKQHQDEIREQLLLDDRNLTCDCRITETTDDPDGLEIEISGTTSAGPYSLTMALTDSGLLIKAMNAEGQFNG
jgi:hypothetical protein